VGRINDESRKSLIPLRIDRETECPAHILFIVKVPEPEQPEVSPVRVHVPVTVLLLIVPCMVSVLLPVVVPVPVRRNCLESAAMTKN
jgi:hypothetical protein